LDLIREGQERSAEGRAISTQSLPVECNQIRAWQSNEEENRKTFGARADEVRAGAGLNLSKTLKNVKKNGPYQSMFQRRERKKTIGSERLGFERFVVGRALER